MKVKNILPDQVKDLLTEDSLNTIENALQEKTALLIETALIDQDELYSQKLEQLIKAIDKDHTRKLKRVVESIDTSNAKKLTHVVKRYESELNKGARKFKTTLVESISDYLEEYIDEAIPVQAIAEATKNKTALTVLSNLRNVLAVDSALMKESVKEAVTDGKNQLNTLTARLAKLENENKVLRESYQKTKADLILEEKTSSLSEKKKEYIKKVLGDKTPKFIEENFDYTLRLFDKKERENIAQIKTEAFNKRVVKADAPRVIHEQASNSTTNPYVDALQRNR
jgi:DNA-binding HxlR family transcriptional regulator